ncbi:Hypothetical predicted protein, partial [Mytilus galloprovincialis]
LFLATILNKTVINQPWTINYSTTNVKLAHRTRCGTKGGRKVVRSFRTLVSSSRDFIPKQNQHGVNINNLSQLAFQTSAIPTSSNQPISSIPSIIKPRILQNKLTSVPNLLNFAKIPKAISNNDKCLSLFSLNCRSVKNKTVSLCDFIQSINVDLLALSETWLGTTIDKLVTSELIPDGYDIHQVSRKDQRGGGLAVVYKTNLDVKLVKNDCHSTHFELMECKIATKNQHLRLCVIYRPPPSKANKFRNSIFFEEWSRFLDRTVVVSEELIITGDLNFHLDDPTDNDAHKFLETLEEHGLSQHVTGKTHVHGHTLDVVITRENSSILSDIPSIQDPHLCDNKGKPSGDHLAISSQINIANKPPKQRKTVTFRKYRDIVVKDLITD